jgi:glucokinase
MLGAVDIGGSKIAVATVRESGQIAARRAVPTSLPGGPEAALRRIVHLMRECETECDEKASGIGIGCTGPVDPATGVIGNVDLLPGWMGFPLTAELQQATGVAAVMENDADAAALAESAWGAGTESRFFLYITVGTGIGVAFVQQGRIYRGAGGWHPEMGHHTLDASGEVDGPCYCGARGCWESLAAGPALAAWFNAHASPSDKLRESAGTREIFGLARSSHELAIRAVEREAHYLAIGLANLVTIFCPDRLALGGGVMESADLLLPRLQHLVPSLCRLIPLHPSAITRAKLGEDAPLLGAARVWQHRVAEPLETQPPS